jgi:Fe-S cluster biogenesis protein NfuA
MNDVMLDRIEEALDSVRPYLNKDGGDVRVVEIKGEVLMIEFQGNCQSCTMSNMTLKAGIEESIRKAVPEIREVKAVNNPS